MIDQARPLSRRLFFLLLAGFMGVGCAHQESRVKSYSLRLRSIDAPERVETVSYSVLAPQPQHSSDRFPLLFALHYAGGNSAEYLNLWKGEALRRKWIVVAPNHPEGYSNQAFEVEIFDRILQALMQTYSVDTQRIYIVGTSIGALGAQWILMNRRDRLKGAIFITSANSRRLSEEEKLPEGPPLLFVHGTRDDLFPILQREVSLLKAKGVHASLVTIPDAGHEHKAEWSEKIFDWMEGL